MNTKSFFLAVLTICNGLAWVKAQSKLHLIQENQAPQTNVFNYSSIATSSQLRIDASRVVEQFASALGNYSTSPSPQDNSKTVTLFKSVMHGGSSSRSSILSTPRKIKRIITHPDSLLYLF
jgi:hypothetical protein